MSSEMIERVAAAISAAEQRAVAELRIKQFGQGRIEAVLEQMGPAKVTDNHRAAAIAVIEAMRDPTDAMVGAGGVYAEYSIKAAWQEMIDAALR